jgi:hypothetical protein
MRPGGLFSEKNIAASMELSNEKKPKPAALQYYRLPDGAVARRTAIGTTEHCIKGKWLALSAESIGGAHAITEADAIAILKHVRVSPRT